MLEQKLVTWAGLVLACLRIIEVALALMRQLLTLP